VRFDRRLSRVLHLLLHLDRLDEPAPSRALATMLKTDAALVRRILAGLRERGWVTAGRGRGGGWQLATPLDAIPLVEVYEALEIQTLFAVAPATDAPECLLEQAANAAVGQALQEGEQAFRTSLAGVTLADLAATVDATT
jgi:DNA-binding IscR family transcriptional regulator